MSETKPRSSGKRILIGAAVGALIGAGVLSLGETKPGNGNGSTRPGMLDFHKPLYAVARSFNVVIWRDRAAFDRGMSLLEAHAGMDLIRPLEACAPYSGTRIAITDGGAFSATVMVIEEPYRGCEGFLPYEFISNSPDRLQDK